MDNETYPYLTIRLAPCAYSKVKISFIIEDIQSYPNFLLKNNQLEIYILKNINNLELKEKTLKIIQNLSQVYHLKMAITWSESETIYLSPNRQPQTLQTSPKGGIWYPFTKIRFA